MRLNSPINPLALARSLRRRMRLWPGMCRVARNWPVWILRQMLQPAFCLRCRIETRAGTRICLADDPILTSFSDAEGAEFEVVPAMLSLGLRPDFLIVMMHPREGSVPDLVRLIRTHGYHVEDADRPPLGARFHCVLNGGKARRPMPIGA